MCVHAINKVLNLIWNRKKTAIKINLSSVDKRAPAVGRFVDRQRDGATRTGAWFAHL